LKRVVGRFGKNVNLSRTSPIFTRPLRLADFAIVARGYDG
jgi:hypothetical protein